jgi:hypothetical protein
VHIIVVCPKCQTRYQIDPAFRGVKMRCPNETCRFVFEAREENQTPPPRPTAKAPAPAAKQRPGGTAQWSGNVGDAVPVLPAESAKPSTEAPSWQSAPPQRRGAPSAPPPVEPAPSAPTDWRNAPPPPKRSTEPVRADWRQAPPPRPGEVPPGDGVEELEEVAPAAPSWESAPPPRRGAAAEEETVEPVEEVGPVEAVEEEVHPVRKRGRRNLIIAGLIVLLLVGVIGGGTFYALSVKQNREATLAAEAEAAYKARQFSEAAAKFKVVLETFPQSDRAREYQFFADLSELRASFAAALAATDGVLSQVNRFLDTYGDDPLLKQHPRDLGEDFMTWLLDRVEKAVKDPTANAALLEKAGDTEQRVRDKVPGAVTPDEHDKFVKLLKEAEAAIKRLQRRRDLIAALTKLESSPENIRIGNQLVADLERKDGGVKDNDKVVEQLERIFNGLMDRVRYVEGGELPRGKAHKEDREPSLVVNQLLQGVPPEPKPNEPVVLALVRGVLYALAQNNGDIVWAMRVGIDTNTLPIRVPADTSPASARPEMVLALSADTLTLTALEAATSRQLWTYHLTAPCLGQPVVVGLRAYVPTYDGIVHEVDLRRGRLLGHYELGQHLTLGGTRQERTDLVYFPADDQCVYVLDVRNHRCTGVLYSGHPAGSLRSPPIVVNPGGGAEGFLILAQTDGLEATSMRAFTLPIDGVQRVPPTVQAPATRGWPWFPPYYDPEKLVLVTDAGAVGMYGIQQNRTKDKALFPLVRDAFRLEVPPGVDVSHPARAQVVACQDDALWVLAHGGLQKLNLVFSPTKGPQLAVDRMWKQPVLIGSPLHHSQVEQTGAGTTLFLVTQAPDGRGCLATALDANTRRILWQRQLGLIAEGVPQPLGKDLLALDQGAGVVAFDPSRPTVPDQQWQTGGRSLAKPLTDNPNFPPSLHLAGDGKTAYQLACPGKGTQLVMRRFQLEGSGRVGLPQDQDEKTVDLPAPPAGAAAVLGGDVLLPLQDGTVFRVQLPDCPPGTPGPEWRAVRGNAGVRGHVVWVKKDEFLTTDGGRGITHWRWPLGKPYVALPPNKAAQDPTAEVRRTIVAAPALLPPKQGALRVCVADNSGTLTLLQGDGLDEEGRWDLGGKITTGPFVRDTHVGCVVDGNRLVWLDPEKPDKEALVWEYRNADGDPIVGEPQMVEDLLVVALQSGRFVGLDPATGKPRGPGFALQASAAPAASPTAFGQGRAFAPLTDGTVLMLALQHLRGR